MTAVVVFSGPTITPEVAASFIPGADCRGPAERGDVLRACSAHPLVICLIDGYFEHRPAVTHKELLWALKQGIRVYGASSMGALRAAELSEFGMLGRGAIFEAFASGRWENEDEVAVPHAEAPDFRVGADALVNIRATLDFALLNGVLDRGTRDDLLDLAQAMFYPERSYAALLRGAAGASLPPSQLAALEAWLRNPQHRIDQKRRDAEALLTEVQVAVERWNLPAPSTDWDFPLTAVWQAALVTHSRVRQRGG